MVSIHFLAPAGISGLPFKRIAGPEDIAKTALFLASDAACNITGKTTLMEGGSLL